MDRGTGHVSTDAAARLALLEQSVQIQREALKAAEQRLEKANLRYKLYNAEIRGPLKQVGDWLYINSSIYALMIGPDGRPHPTRSRLDWASRQRCSRSWPGLRSKSSSR